MKTATNTNHLWWWTVPKGMHLQASQWISSVLNRPISTSSSHAFQCNAFHKVYFCCHCHHFHTLKILPSLLKEGLHCNCPIRREIINARKISAKFGAKFLCKLPLQNNCCWLHFCNERNCSNNSSKKIWCRMSMTEFHKEGSHWDLYRLQNLTKILMDYKFQNAV